MVNTYRGPVQEPSSFLEQRMVLDLRCAISLSTHLSPKQLHPDRFVIEFVIYNISLCVGEKSMLKVNSLLRTMYHITEN